MHRKLEFPADSNFHYDLAARRHLLAVRHPNGLTCPRCHGIDMAPASSNRFRCRGCQLNFSGFEGTPLEGTQLPFQVWTRAFYLAEHHPEVFKPARLSVLLEVSYTTADRIHRRIEAFTGGIRPR